MVTLHLRNVTGSGPKGKPGILQRKLKLGKTGKLRIQTTEIQHCFTYDRPYLTDSRKMVFHGGYVVLSLLAFICYTAQPLGIRLKEYGKNRKQTYFPGRFVLTPRCICTVWREIASNATHAPQH